MLQELRPPLHVTVLLGPDGRLVHTLHVRFEVDLAAGGLESAPPAIVRQPHGVHHHEVRGHFRVEESETAGHLSTDRMTDDRGFGDPKVLEEACRVRRVKADAVRKNGLRGSPPAESILYHDAKTLVPQCLDLLFPIPAVVAPPMQENHGLTVRRAHRRNVHIRDADVLPVEVQTQKLYGMRIGNFLDVD